jgi:basic membrane protein A
MARSAERGAGRLPAKSGALGLLAAISLGIALGNAPAQAADKAAMLFPGSINDQSWNADGYAGLMQIKALGFDIAYSENVDAADHVDAMRDYAHQGFKLIIGHSGRFLTAAQQVGPESPDTQFIVAAGSRGFGGNVLSIDFNNRHFGCLLGTLAAAMSRTGKIGGVYGLEGLPTTIDQVGSFRICAKQARPDIQVGVLYIADLESAAAAKEAAFSLIASGADVLSGQLNAGQQGLIQAAKEKDVFVTGRSYGQTAIAPYKVLTNVIEQWPQMYAAAAADVKAGRLSGGLKIYGLDTPASPGASLSYAPDQAYNKAVPASVIAAIGAVQARLADGTLKIEPTGEDARGGE